MINVVSVTCLILIFNFHLFPKIIMMAYELLFALEEIESRPSTSDKDQVRVPHYPFQCSLKHRNKTTTPDKPPKGTAEGKRKKKEEKKRKKSEG